MMTVQQDSLLQCQCSDQTEEIKQHGRLEEKAANKKLEERPRII